MLELTKSGGGDAPLMRLTFGESSGALIVDVGTGEVRDEHEFDQADVMVAAPALVLLAIAAGANMGEAIQEGDVRLSGPDMIMTTRQEYAIARWLVKLLTSGADAAGGPGERPRLDPAPG